MVITRYNISGIIDPASNFGKRADQRVSNPFGSENKQLHDGMPREYPPDYKP